jgi:hypothetical protein
MRKLFILLLLLPFSLLAQTTYQLNYDSIRVNKTTGTGGTSLYGKVYLKNVTTGLTSDSILSVRNGRILKVPAPSATGGTGGGASVSYYLNGSVNQGTFVGNVYLEMNKTPILGAGTNFTIASNGYISQFITDANDPGSLLIPAGNWNFETYLSASSNAGSPSFYVELYKYDGSTFTLIASNSATPELISFGTRIHPYFSALAVPETVLSATDRLAVRIYINNSGRTITLHTEGTHLCQIVTTFTTGLQSLNGLTKQVQSFATGTSGTDFNISSVTDLHTFNIPSASGSNRGLVTTGTQTFAGAKTFNSDLTVNGLNIGKGLNSVATNTSIGASALVSNTTGLANTAIGFSALNANTDGNFNTAVGIGSLQYNISGIANSALGYVSLSANISGGQNSAFGNTSLTSNTTGSRNTALGYGALSDNTTANNNTAIGHTTGLGITTGSNNTIIGANVTGLSPTLSDNIILANGSGNIKAQHDNTNWNLTGGVSATDTISSTPQGTLYGTASGSITSAELATSLTDETGTGSAVFSASPTFTGTITGATATFSGDLSATAGTVTFTNAANVYMPSVIRNGANGKAFFQYDGTDTRLLKLSIGLWSVRNDANNANLLTITDAGGLALPQYGSGSLTTDASGNVTATSDERMKDIFKFYTTGLSALKNIKPITYKWKAETKLDTANFYTGFSAQNIHKNIPEAAGHMANGDLTVQDRPIMATIINAINELHEKIIALEARITALEAQTQPNN